MSRRILFILLSVYIFTFGISPVLGVPADLAHHWNFDEGPDWHDDVFQAVSQATTAYDSVGAADADPQNMDGADWVSGRQFTCLEFDGSDDYLYTATDLSQTLGSTASLSFWIRTTQTGGTSGTESPGITGVEQSGGSNDIQWGWIDSNGKIALSVGSTKVVVSDNAINDGQWHHIAFTRDATSGECKIYVDAALDDTATGGTGNKTTAFYSIARVEDTGGTPRYFQGRLDQIHVFNQVIDLTTVQQIMNNHAPKTWSSTTQGTNDAIFSTESVFFKSYDPEQDALTVLSYTQPAHGAVVDNGDGTFNYTVDTDYTGSDSFVAIVDDDNGGLSRTVMNVIVLDPAGPDASKRTTTFINFQALQAGGVDISLSGWRVPRAIDWDGDSDNDLLIGHGGTVWRYNNSGSASSHSFDAGVKVQANGSEISLSGSVLITLVDMTGDSVDDLVAVDSSRKVRVYENTSATGQIPVYTAASIVKTPEGSDFLLPDQRFDAGDWDGDGLPDIVMGTRQSEIRAYKNVGSASDPRFDTAQYEVLMSGAYNLYPRLFDISRNGVLDLLRGINWGSVTYWFDPLLHDGLGPSGNLVITDTLGDRPDLHALTDGAMVDFADYNDDGVLDLLVGGHWDSEVYIAYGLEKTVADCITENEAIYDAHPTDLGDALEANDQELLGQINDNSRAIISHMLAATLPERQIMFTQMSTHVGSYSFLQMNAPLNTSVYHHVPSIAGQNLITMHQMLPDTPTHRLNVANAVGLTGLHRDIYLNSYMHVGDNQNGTQGQMESVRDFLTYQPREIYPDTMLTLNHYYGDGRGGHVNSFTGAKNTFNFGEGSDADEWASDLDQPIQDVFGTNAHRGDYFTLVLGHEATHSLDWYVRGRDNGDLERRWGQMLVHAGGPDIMAGSNGWIDWTATKTHFQTQGYWDGVEANWNAAWSDYWTTGSGSAWRSLSFMRGSIDWFFSNSQESLATQGNHRWMHSEGRLVGAIDRWRRGIESNIEPMKANITEVTTFLDYVSAGLNKVVMYDTHGVSSPYPHATYGITRAWLERNDKGYITKVTVNDRSYQLTVDSTGIVTDVTTNIFTAQDDNMAAFHNRKNVLEILRNDYKLEGGQPAIDSFTQPAHGNVTDNGNGTLTYTPHPGYFGSDSFSYTVISNGSTDTATVNLIVSVSLGVLMETFTDIGGTAVSNLTNNTKYPYSPDEVAVQTNFEAPTDRADNYGVRMRAWLMTPTTGDYTFWIASDDNGELWLSTDNTSSNASKIAYVTGWSSSQQWDKYPEQQSNPVTLVTGKTYYLEALMKEGSGLDNLAVAWQGPGISRQVIPGAYLLAYHPQLLVNHWQLDETSGTTATDAVGDNYGTLTNFVDDDSQWVTGKFDGALQFDGLDDFVDLGNSSSLKPDLPITIAAWIQLDEAGTDYQIIINLDKKDYDSEHRFYGPELLVMNTGELAVSFGDGQPNHGGKYKIGNSALQPNIWYHVAAVILNADDMSLYINGKDDGGVIGGTGGDLVYADGNSQLGSRNGDAFFLRGDLDDVRLYNDALRADQVKSVMDFRIGWWKLNETTGWIAADDAGCNHGILPNFTGDDSQWVPGKLDGALQFDGLADFVDLGNSPSIKPALPITLVAWVQLKDVGDPQILINIDKKDYDDDHRLYGPELLVMNTGELAALVGDGQPNFSSRYKIGESVLRPNSWYHVAAVIREIDDMSLYVNGRDDGGVIGGTGGAMVYADGSSQLGVRNNNAFFFHGDMDDVGIYDRALSEEEIAVLARPLLDLNSNGRIGLVDLYLWSGDWLETSCDPLPRGDFDVDCDVDLTDYARLAAQWMQDVN